MFISMKCKIWASLYHKDYKDFGCKYTHSIEVSFVSLSDCEHLMKPKSHMSVQLLQFRSSSELFYVVFKIHINVFTDHRLSVKYKE